MNPEDSNVPDSKTISTNLKWLLMVYMQAGDSSNLDSLGVQDLKELQEGVQGSKEPKISGNSNVAVLVQMKRPWPNDVPQRYLIEYEGPVETLKQAEEQKTATRESLERFLSEGLKIAGANVEHFCLVLWGHNFGLGFGRDHDDPLTLQELDGALKAFEKKRGKRLELLATNSCTMAYIEAAYELQKSADYLVASQVFMPLTGFPYRSIVRSIGPSTGPEALGTIFVDQYIDSFAASPNGERVAMSLLKPVLADDFKDLLMKTADAIRMVIKPDGQAVDQKRLREVQDVFLANPAGDVRPVLDLRSLAEDLISYSDDCLAADPITATQSKSAVASEGLQTQEEPESPLKSLRQRADELLVALPRPDDSSAVENKKQSSNLVVRHRDNQDLGPLGGVGVFAPFVVDKATRKNLELAKTADRELYGNFALFGGNATSWPDLVYDTLRRDEPDEIVNAAGVVQPADRVQVNQLVSAVDAAFNVLDRVLKSTSRLLLDDIVAWKADASGLTSVPLGPPRLKLLGDLSLQPPSNGLLLAKAPESIVKALGRIERAAGLVETTIKRVLTNGTFGLGPPEKSVGFGPKTQTLGPKTQTLGPKTQTLGPKTQTLGPKTQTLGPKTQTLGSGDLSAEVGAISAFLSSDAQIAMLSISVMFSAIARALSNLEDAVSDIEATVAQCLLQPGYGDDLSAADYKGAITQLFDRAFSVATGASLQARRTARQVMAHPVYGLGNGPETFGQPERDELAIIAGLSQSQLLLL